MDNTALKITTERPLCYVNVTTYIRLPLSEVTRRFDRKLFDYLAPAFPKLKILRYDGQHRGDQIQLKVGFWPIFLPWDILIADSWDESDRWGFIDQGLRLPPPLTAWRHEHRVELQPDGTTAIIDNVGFRIGPLWLSRLCAPLIRKQFEARRPLYERYFYKQKL